MSQGLQATRASSHQSPATKGARGGTALEASAVRLSIVMPAYNEGSTVARAIHHVLSIDYPCPIELIVVNDGSSDRTEEELQSITDERLTVLSHPVNLGKGAALRTGIRHATGTHMLPFDADMEYSAHDIPAMLAPVIAGRASVVYGTRLFGVNTVYHSLHYALGNRVMTLATNVLFGSYISDLHTCLKLIPLDVLRGLDLVEAGFGLDTEMTANVLKLGMRPFEVPVSYFARSHSEGKKINWRDAVRCFAVLARVRLSRTRYQPVTPGSGVAVIGPAAVSRLVPAPNLAASRDDVLAEAAE